MIEVAGLPVKRISKKLSEGHPNIVDMVRNGTVTGVINTSTGGRVPLRDGFHIRRAAAEKRVPCFTSLDTARVAIDALADRGHNYSIKSVQEYRNG